MLAYLCSLVQEDIYFVGKARLATVWRNTARQKTQTPSTAERQNTWVGIDESMFCGAVLIVIEHFECSIQHEYPTKSDVDYKYLGVNLGMVDDAKEGGE